MKYTFFISFICLVSCDSAVEVPVVRSSPPLLEEEFSDEGGDMCIDTMLEDLVDLGLEDELPEVIDWTCEYEPRVLPKITCGSRHSFKASYLNLFPGWNLPKDEFACCSLMKCISKPCNPCP